MNTGICLTIIALTIIGVIRVEIVSHVRNKRFIELMKLNKPIREWRNIHNDFQYCPSFNQQVLDLTKWTYKQFYPRSFT